MNGAWNLLEFSVLIGGASLLAGLLGALTGLGGGVVLTPVLTLLFGVDIRYAIGATLVSVIATSSGAAAAYVKEGYSNIRIGMLLEIATTRPPRYSPPQRSRSRSASFSWCRLTCRSGPGSRRRRTGARTISPRS